MINASRTPTLGAFYFMKSEIEILEQLEKARAWIESGEEYSVLSFEDGVETALAWVLEESKIIPIEYEPEKD